ncbi:MAG: zinc ribbon domain-containing protein [Candidatus Helarchaeota archaeon]|nr:zinc ribbon domain-containing protein [Candidatus Helarchaeota archaeon]
MVNSKFETFSNLMVERNLIFDVLQILSRELEMKEINPKLFKIIQSKYLAKLKSLDIQLSKASRNLICSKCEQRFDDDELTLSCIKCGFPFHQKHLNESQLNIGNYCANCGSFFRIREFDDFKSVELKKVQYAYKKLHSKISVIGVKIDGKEFKLKHSVPSEKEEEKIKTRKKPTKCPNCGQKIDIKWRFCKKCGYLLKSKGEREENKCKSCGTYLDPGWRFCKWCGAPANT